MGLLSNKIDRQELKPGDHIYCWRKAFIYAHHGIYVGASLVIHFTQGPAGKEKGRVLISSSLPDPKISDVPCPRCGDHNSSFNNGVILSCIDCFLSGGKLNLFEYGVSRAYFLADVRGGTCTLATSDPPRDVLHRANILLEKGFGDYDVFKNNREDFAIYCRTGLLVISSSTRVGQSGQVAALGATSSWIFSSLANKFKGVTAVGSGVCATAVGSGVYYCYSRLNSDIGVRSDVAKVAVERLVPPAPVKRLVPTAPPAPAPVERLVPPAPVPAPISYEPEDHASSTSTREMMTPSVTPTPVIVDHQSSSVLAQQLAILKQPIGVKLNDNNFVLWKQEVTAAIQGLGLQGFLDGKSICPPETTMNSDGNQVTNPAHDFWIRQDQLIVSWLLGSISYAYLLDLVDCNTANDIWSTLMDLFVSQTHARVSQYKQDIGRLKKNNLTMREYLSKMKSLSDALASVGHSLSEEDQVSNIFNGLGAEYESVIVHVTTKVDPYTVSEVTDLLLAHEKRIESCSLNPDGSTPSANLAFNNGQKKQNVAGSQNFKPNQYTYNQQFQGNRGNGRGRGRGRGNGGRGWSNNKPQCQLCGKFGHTRRKCYHRSDPFFTDFQSKSNSSGNYGRSFGNFGGNSGTSGGSSGNSRSQGFYPSANVATQDSMNDNNTWSPDSGATNHVTSAFSNLNVGSIYHGNSKLQMGNGAGFGQGWDS